MRILVFVIPEKGHVNPLLPTVRHLARRGHQVTVAAFGDVAAAFSSLANVELLESAGPPPERITRGRAFAEKLRDAAWLSSWVEALLVDAVPAQLPAVSACIDRVRPDVVVTDPMIYAAAIACERAKVPWAAVSSSLNPVTPTTWRSALTDTLARIHDKRRRLFVEHGVGDARFRVSDVESPWLNVVFTVDEYAPRAAADNARVFAVGAPFVDEERELRDPGLAYPWQDLRRDSASGALERRAYCSFGSQAFHQPVLFSAVFAACTALGLRVVASVGDLVDDAELMSSVPKGAVVARSFPQLLVFNDVDVVVSHGGANTVVEALASGLPLVLLPLCNDQPLQARFLEAAGAGAVVDAESATDATIKRALEIALGDDVAARVRHIARALREAGGPARVAALVEELGRERKPMSAVST